MLESPVIIPATLIAFADVLPPASAPRSVRAYVPGVPAPDELLLVKFPLDDSPHPVRTAAAATRIVAPRMPILSRVIKFGRDRPRAASGVLLGERNPGDCTGKPIFAALQNVFGDRYLNAGLGSTLAVGADPLTASKDSCK